MSKVLIVDDHPIVREGIAQLINREPDLTVSAVAPDAATALRAIRADRPDIVILDLSLGRDSGLDLLEELRREGSDLPVLVLSMHDEKLFAERALRKGARGYVMKQEATDVLLTAVRQVLGGTVYVSRAMNDRLLEKLAGGRVDATDPLGGLSDRELQVFRLIGTGLKTGDLAKRLRLSVKTVEAHRANIKEKLGLRSAEELLIHAAHFVEHGRIKPS